ncbi:MAG: Rpn family recombination-promoting nuclease/putative transposase [Candidatus Contendobacter sp.]
MFALKQGRAARLPAAPVTEYRFGWEIPYDHWQERLGRTVLWAAGKLPAQPLPLRREPAAGVGSDAGSHPDSRLVVTLPADAPIAQVRIRERRDDGLVVRDWIPYSPPWPRRGGAERRGGLSPALDLAPELFGPAAAGLPAGRYVDEVIASDAAGRVVAWATLPFVVASPQRVELDLSRTWGEIGDALAGRVSVAGRTLEQGRVSVELRDRRGRILAATPGTKANAGGAPFSFAIPEWFPMLVQVRAVLRDDTGEVADAVAYFNVTQRHRDRFNLLSWDVPRGPTAAWAHEALAGLGVTLELGNFMGNPPPVMAAYDMAVVPYTTRIRAEKEAFLDPQLTQHPADWLYAVTRRGGEPGYLCVLFEHKSYVEARINLDLLRYRVRIWEQWLNDGNTGLLPAIIPVVVYHGAATWRVSRQFADGVAAPLVLRECVPECVYYSAPI